ncbi:hypothetical protein HWV07_07075 [Natronomonas salina]|uniref:HalOD1 output domain-containing protein n=1 Tax=Natronomonas salina TaxID=1710540 RepID=UPI0015B734AC|nr:HalOD1 output domain-containing protein [Natronomonas salina]QLD88808.1 hypothetical protein HWV07_07075 [Natronomonas salina]
MSQMMVGQTESVTASIVEKIAAAEGASEVDITPLFESIDPDAIDTMFADARASAHVTIEFTHDGYDVRIDGGEVSIDRHAGDL